ncbi:MAG: SDR family NAD(P)-dependent oxidoreductase [Pseudomonadota bacterium]
MTTSKGAGTRRALVTGSAGFIGYHLCRRLLTENWTVIGLDSLNDYYDVRLKECRHAMLTPDARFTPVIAKLEDEDRLKTLFETHRPEVVVHLAAQAGVRYSIEAPRSYVESNLIGTYALLEAMRAYPPEHSLLASTSSIYGANTERPYVETHATDLQMSFYAATKKATEAMSHSYAHLYGLPVTMFRFFTVYGPWGRPDMALFKFVRAILRDEAIDVYNHGRMMRDFTYVDDLVTGIRHLIDVVPPGADHRGAAVPGDSLSPVAPWRVVNIGNGVPVRLPDFITAIEEAVGRRAHRNLVEMRPGDVFSTWASTCLLERLTGSRPSTPLREGVARFVSWYRSHYGV